MMATQLLAMALSLSSAYVGAPYLHSPIKTLYGPSVGLVPPTWWKCQVSAISAVSSRGDGRQKSSHWSDPFEELDVVKLPTISAPIWQELKKLED